MTRLRHDPDFELHVGDARETLTTLPDGSVDCVVTSPPYWGLRDYSTNGQLGLEATPDEYVANMVAVFREVRRVLADHGSLWLNLGDSYAGSWGAQSRDVEGTPEAAGSLGMASRVGGSLSATQITAHPKRTKTGSIPAGSGLKPKDLVGIPWRVAFALQADGWYLRSDIIWSKPNPMPESVTDRPTKAHEYVFLLSKGPRYFFDQEAVREPYTPDDRVKRIHDHATDGAHDNYASMGEGRERWANAGRNVRSVWEIATRPFSEAHFATYPPELVRRCLLAGCPERVCRSCGRPSERIVEQQRNGRDWNRNNREGGDRMVVGQSASEPMPRDYLPPRPVGWSDCGHGNYRPGTVLDPFLGSGTTALVAREQGRRCVGIELNEEYAEMAARRLGQLSLLA